MGYDFERSSSQYVDVIDSVAAPAGLGGVSTGTVSVWMKPESVTGATETGWRVEYTAVELRNEGTTGIHVPFSFGIYDSVLACGFSSNYTTAQQRVVASTTLSTGTLYHAAVTISGDDVNLYLNGSDDISGGGPFTLVSAAGTRSVGTSTASNMQIGIRSRDAGQKDDAAFDGIIYEVGVWDVELSSVEVAALAAGCSPLLIRPTSLVFYAPLVRNEGRDEIGGLALTPTNTPLITEHCRIVMPPHRSVVAPLSLAASGAIAGTATGAATVSGTLVGTGALAGAATGAGTASGTIAGTGALAGSSAGAATVAGTLVGSGALAGASTGAATVTATLVGTGALAGTSTGAATVAGSVAGTGALAGSSTGSATVTATLAGTGALAGSAVGAATVTGSVTGPGAISGSATGAATVTATLVGTGALSGSVSGAATATATLGGWGYIAGTATGTATVTGSISNASAEALSITGQTRVRVGHEYRTREGHGYRVKMGHRYRVRELS